MRNVSITMASWSFSIPTAAGGRSIPGSRPVRDPPIAVNVKRTQGAGGKPGGHGVDQCEHPGAVTVPGRRCRQAGRSPGKSNDPTEMTMPCRPAGGPPADGPLPLEDVQAASATVSPMRAAPNIARVFIRTPAAAARARTASPARRGASRWPAGTAARCFAAAADGAIWVSGGFVMVSPGGPTARMTRCGPD